MSLIEVLMGLVVASVLLTVVFRFFGGILFDYRHGFVNLQNFQDAHIAISWLRRDFSNACPYLSEKDGDQELRNTVRRPIELEGEHNLGENQRIHVTEHRITFFRSVVEPFSEDDRPTVEPIEYSFDPNTGILKRRGRAVKEFRGFKDVRFKVYVLRERPEVPLLWVKLVIDHGESSTGQQAGKPLELVTTIGSTFVNDIIQYKNWNYRAFHKTTR